MLAKDMDMARLNVLKNIAKLMSKYEFKVEDLRPHLDAEAFTLPEPESTQHSSDEAKAYFDSLSPPSDKDMAIEGWKLKMILV